MEHTTPHHVVRGNMQEAGAGAEGGEVENGGAIFPRQYCNRLQKERSKVWCYYTASTLLLVSTCTRNSGVVERCSSAMLQCYSVTVVQ